MSKQPTSLATAKYAAQLALSKKAFDVVIVDLRKIKNAFADFFVICSCDSDTQVRAVADAVQRGMKDVGMPPAHVEGVALGQWALIDCFDMVVHVFHRAARTYYTLERLWGDAKVTRVRSEFDTLPEPKPARIPEVIDVDDTDDADLPTAAPKPKRASTSRVKAALKAAPKAKAKTKAAPKSKPAKKTAPKTAARSVAKSATKSATKSAKPRARKSRKDSSAE